MSVTDWWPEPGSTADAEWAVRTMHVVDVIASKQGRILYPGNGFAHAKEDLRDYLITRGLEYRERYVPEDPDAPASEQLEAWCGVLGAILTKEARWHFSRFYKLGLSDADTWEQVASQDSLDRPMPDQHGNDGGQTFANISRRIYPVSSDIEDPLLHVIHVEELCDLLWRRFRIRVRNPRLETVLDLLDKMAPEPGAGQCSVFGCGYPPRRGRASAGGYCTAHFNEIKERTEKSKPCSVDGCTKKAYRRGMCSSHEEAERLRNAGPCSVDGCEKRQRRRGLCDAHYRKGRKDGSLPRAVARQGEGAETRPCSVDGCSKPQNARGLCNRHYKQMLRKEVS